MGWGDFANWAHAAVLLQGVVQIEPGRIIFFSGLLGILYFSPNVSRVHFETGRIGDGYSCCLAKGGLHSVGPVDFVCKHWPPFGRRLAAAAMWVNNRPHLPKRVVCFWAGVVGRRWW